MTEQPRLLATTASFPRWKGDAEGGGAFLLELLTRLSRDFEVHVLAPHFKDAPAYFEIDNIKVHRYQFFPFNGLNLINSSGLAETLSRQKWKIALVPFLLFFQLTSVHRIMKARKIQLIHAHWSIPQGLVAAIYKKYFNSKIKVLLTSHGSDLNASFGSAGKMMNSFVLKNINALTVVGSALKTKAAELGCRADIEVIPMGIDAKFFTAVEDPMPLREKLGVKKRMLLFVGYFNEVKGIVYLIRAMPEILKHHPQTMLTLIGDGLLKNSILDLVKELGIESNVNFQGLIPNSNLPEYYSAADIVIMPSIEEGFGLVWVEAMSCGTLVIASDIPVFKNHIRDGENGILFKVKDSRAIAEKVIEVLNAPESYDHIRLSGRNYVRQNFDWEIIAGKYSELLKKVSGA